MGHNSVSQVIRRMSKSQIVAFACLTVLALSPTAPVKPKNLLFCPGDAIFPVVVSGKMGFIDGAGKIVIEPRFEVKDFMEDASGFCEGMAIIPQGEKRGFIDKTGTMIIPAQFDEALSFSEGFAAIKIRGKWGYIDKSGGVALAPQFEDAGSFSEGLAKISLRSKWGFIDSKGKIVIKPTFREVGDFSEGLASIRNQDGQLGFIDRTGTIVINPKYEPASGGWVGLEGLLRSPYVFAEGLAAVNYNGSWGFINKAGRMVIKPRFEYATAFSDGLASVEIGQKWASLTRPENGLLSRALRWLWIFARALLLQY